MIAVARLLLIAILTSILAFQPFARAEDLVIGVRDDARPFVWKHPSTGDYVGFFWDICSFAAQKAGYQPLAKSMDATQRKEFLDGGNTGGYDLLCDPTTITVNRMRTFAKSATHLAFSPIVFVANGTYVSQRNANSKLKGAGKIPDELKEAALKEKNNACDKLRNRKSAEPEQRESDWITLMPKLKKADSDQIKEEFEIWGYLVGSTIGELLQNQKALLGRNSNVLVCPVEIPSHKKAAEEFCAGNLARYYGDAEIIKSAIQTYNEENNENCSFVPAPLGTYEPYAFVTSSRKSAFPNKFALALYEMFSDQTIERLFAAHFREEKSEFLSTLFRINRIPKGVAPPTAGKPQGGEGQNLQPD